MMGHARKRKIVKNSKQELTKDPGISCQNSNKNTFSKQFVRQTLLLIIISIIIFFIGSFYVNAIHENERSFSQLSDIEREMSFRSEMGLYYYFYKTFIKASSWREGLWKLRHENYTEFPDTINALQRFNILPEIIIGFLYRITKYLNLISMECYAYKRSDGFEYDTCVGLEEPVYFYLQFAWFSAGFTSLFVFLFGFYLSQTAYGGLISLLSFFYNHIECTRVHWAPPLRETFAYPLLLLQMLVVSITLNKNSKLNKFNSLFEPYSIKVKSSLKTAFGLIFHAILLAVLCFLSLTFWQFSQFVLCTQFIIILFLFICGQLPYSFMFLFSLSQMWGIALATIFLQFNEMLMSSIFSCLVFSTVLIFIICSSLRLGIKWKRILFVICVPCITLFLRMFFNTEDDNHIFNLLKSKVTGYQDFHTLIYTCSSEFDFLTLSVLINLSFTWLLPIMVLVLTSMVSIWIRSVKLNRLFGDVEIHVAYNFIQAFIFCIMAFFFMRLKLFSNPHLCILASLFTSKYMPKTIRQNNVLCLFWLIILMSGQGVRNIIKEHSNSGTFSYLPLEELLDFINRNLPSNAVLAGPMATASAVVLSTQRPVILHPHYEHVKIRNRTKDVYTIFSRKSEDEIFIKLEALKVDYVAIDHHWCFSRSQVGCLITDLWDLDDVKNRKKKSFCSKAFDDRKMSKFKTVFRNDVFRLLKLQK